MRLSQITQFIKAANSANSLPRAARIGFEFFKAFACATAGIMTYRYMEQKDKTPKVTKGDAIKHFNENYKVYNHSNVFISEYNGDFEGNIFDKITHEQKLKTYCNGQVKRERVYENNEFSYPEKVVGYNYYETKTDKWTELVKEVKYNRDGDTIYYFNKYEAKTK